MPVLVKDQQIVEDPWQLLETIPDYVPSNAIVPAEQIKNSNATAAWVDGDSEIEEYGDKLSTLDLVAVHFPMFADGRGLSLGALLRKRYEFEGELRAFGQVQPDLTPFMSRCGFDAFVLENELAAQTAIRCMSSMSDFYQGSVIQPEPPYRRKRAR